MHTVVIVDDEHWILQGIKSGVNWEGLGFQVVGTAENGQEALILIEDLKPDFVLTDIKMPLVNGLELIKQGKQFSPNTCFAVLSGHAEFAYAQKALNYGTMFYCLKPFEIDEIESMLKKVSHMLNEKTSLAATDDDNSLYEAICTENTAWIEAILTEKNMPISETNPITALVLMGNYSLKLSPPTSNTIQFRMSKRRICVLVYEHRITEFLQSHVQDELDYSIGMGIPATSADQLQQSLELASIAAYGFFATERNDIYAINEKEQYYSNYILQELTQALHHKDNLAFTNTIERCKGLFRQNLLNIKDAYLIFNTVMYLFTKENVKSSIRFLEGYEQLFHEYGQAIHMLDYLVQHTQNYFSEEISAKLNTIGNVRIKEILMYIHANLHQDISIRSLSEQFFLSPTYLSQLFKKEVGENFVEYLSRHRIELACKLLLETNLSVSQISEKSGFNDYFYFTRIFKRFTQQTPTQYRGKS